MKTTKCIALLLAIVMTLALFAGCSNSPANDPATDAPATDARTRSKPPRPSPPSARTAAPLPGIPSWS